MVKRIFLMMNYLFATSEFCDEIFTRDSFWDIYSQQPDFLCEKHIFNHDEFVLFSSIENRKSNITLCWPRPESTTTAETISNWVLLAVNTSVSAHCQSPTQEIQTSSVHCQKLKANYKFSVRIVYLKFNGINFIRISWFEK